MDTSPHLTTGVNGAIMEPLLHARHRSLPSVYPPEVPDKKL